MIQDYMYLNEWTVKNNYPLPSISDIIENIDTKKVFTKIDLRWRYNNVWIKEGDKWNVAFTILERSFEPTVMFFRLTNLPVTFQTMINEILYDLINTRKVASFIDNVIVEREMVEGHDELVEEVVRKLVLWQPLIKRPIATQAINLKVDIKWESQENLTRNP